MAIKTLYVTSPFKYNTRMMQAGEPVQMTGPHQRLYIALGKVSREKPKAAKADTFEIKETANASEVKGVKITANAKRAPAKKKAAKKTA